MKALRWTAAALVIGGLIVGSGLGLLLAVGGVVAFVVSMGGWPG